MAQYIDKDALVAEIEKRITNIKEYCVRKGHDRRFDVVSEQLSQILAFINTLEVKEEMMANTADAMIGLPYENKDGGYTHLIDVSRPLPVGSNKIAIIFKED